MQESDIVERPFSLSTLATWGIGGFLRRLFAIYQGRDYNEPGRRGLGFEEDITGALGEGILAEDRNLFYAPTIGSLDKEIGDVAELYQVKTITLAGGGMFVRPDDPVDFPYVLVEIRLRPRALPMAYLIGWLPGCECKQKARWKPKEKPPVTKKDAFYVPRELLRPIATLPFPAQLRAERGEVVADCPF